MNHGEQSSWQRARMAAGEGEGVPPTHMGFSGGDNVSGGGGGGDEEGDEEEEDTTKRAAQAVAMMTRTRTTRIWMTPNRRRI